MAPGHIRPGSVLPFSGGLCPGQATHAPAGSAAWTKPGDFAL